MREIKLPGPPRIVRCWLRAVIGAVLVAAALGAQAQDSYPVQSVKVIVPFPPGGGTDVVTRLLTERMHAATGWNFVVDNRPGAGGNIGLDLVAKSKPDGYTVGMGQTANLAINPSLYPKMPYDVARDFVPVALVAGQPVVLVVNSMSPYKSLADLVAAAKTTPGTLTMASAGNGTVGHLTGELFARQANIKINHIPYKGAGPAATDLLGAQVEYYFATPQTVIPFVKAGKLRALAVSSIKRLPVLPDVPTLSESGYRGFETSDWKMLVAPSGTPAEIVRRLNAEVVKTLSKPETLSQLLAEGSVPMSGSPEDAARYLKSEQQRWSAVIRSGGIKLD